jgi:hypothetical protein
MPGVEEGSTSLGRAKVYTYNPSQGRPQMVDEVTMIMTQ